MKTMESQREQPEKERPMPADEIEVIQSRLERKRLERAKARAKAAFTVLFVLFLIKGIFYLIATPPWQAPDETFHFNYALMIAGEPEGNKSHESIIIESMARWNFWRYQMQLTPTPLPYGFSDIPFFSTIGTLERQPLYYQLTAPLLWSTVGLPVESRLYILRTFNLLLASLILVLTYLISKTVFAKDRFLALAPPAFIAFLPQFSFISTSFTNDVMIDLLFAAFILIAVLSVLRGYNLNRAITLIFIMAVSIFVKRSAVIMVVVAVFLPYFIVLRKPKRRLINMAIIGATELGLATLALMLLRISQPTRAFIRDTLKVHLETKTLESKVTEFFTGGTALEHVSFNIRTVVESFWAHFGWMNIPLDPWAYWLPWALLFVSVFGLILGMLRLKPLLSLESPVLSVMWMMAAITFITFVFGFVRTSIYEFVPFQGRYMFPALPAIAILVAWGVRSFFPRVDAQRLTAGFVAIMFAFELVAIFGFMLPGYYFI